MNAAMNCLSTGKQRREGENAGFVRLARIAPSTTSTHTTTTRVYIPLQRQPTNHHPQQQQGQACRNESCRAVASSKWGRASPSGTTFHTFRLYSTIFVYFFVPALLIAAVPNTAQTSVPFSHQGSERSLGGEAAVRNVNVPTERVVERFQDSVLKGLKRRENALSPSSLVGAGGSSTSSSGRNSGHNGSSINGQRMQLYINQVNEPAFTGSVEAAEKQHLMWSTEKSLPQATGAIHSMQPPTYGTAPASSDLTRANPIKNNGPRSLPEKPMQQNALDDAVNCHEKAVDGKAHWLCGTAQHRNIGNNANLVLRESHSTVTDFENKASKNSEKVAGRVLQGKKKPQRVRIRRKKTADASCAVDEEKVWDLIADLIEQIDSGADWDVNDLKQIYESDSTDPDSHLHRKTRVPREVQVETHVQRKRPARDACHNEDKAKYADLAAQRAVQAGVDTQTSSVVANAEALGSGSNSFDFPSSRSTFGTSKLASTARSIPHLLSVNSVSEASKLLKIDESPVMRAVKRAARTYITPGYYNETKLIERWVYEFQSSFLGGNVEKRRASYSKAPAAKRVMCEITDNRRAGEIARVCAALRLTEEAVQEIEESVPEGVDVAEQHQHGSAENRVKSSAVDIVIKRIGGGHVGSSTNSLGSSFARDPFMQTLLSDTPKEEEQQLQRVQEEEFEKESTPTPARSASRGLQRRSQLKAADVNLLVDMTEFGEVSDFNSEAYLRQRACNGLYSTMLIDSPHCSGNLECTLRSLTAYSRNVAKRHAVTARSRLVRIFTRIFWMFRQDEALFDILRSAQLHFSRASRKQEAFNPGAVMNSVLRIRPTAIPVFTALITSLLVCQATLPYYMRQISGFPVMPMKYRRTTPALQALSIAGAIIELPQHIPPHFPLQIHIEVKQQALHNLPHWKRSLYKSLWIIWNLVYHLYHLGERPDDFRNLNVDSIFPWPWRLSQLGSVIWSERVPVRNYDGSVRPSVMRRLRGLKLGLTKYTFYEKLKKLLDPPDESAAFTTSHGGTQELPVANPDTCGQDATLRVAVESPSFARLDLHPEAGRKSLHIGSILEKDEKTQKTKSGETAKEDVWKARFTGSPIRVDTCWLFKGTDSPKNWNTNTQLALRKDSAFSRKALFHSGYSAYFHNVLRGSMESFIEEMLFNMEAHTKHSPYVVLFTGHSMGGALAQLAAWFFAKHLQQYIRLERIVVFCVTFGASSIGNRKAYNEMQRQGIHFFRFRSDMDPVPFIMQDAGISNLHNPRSSTVVLRSTDFTQVELRDEMGRLNFHGLLWAQESLQPLRVQKWILRLLTSPLKLDSLVDIRIHPINSHLYIYACVFALLAGAFREAGWSSMCAAPLVQKWPLMPYPATPEMEQEMKKAHAALPQQVQMLEESRNASLIEAGTSDGNMLAPTFLLQEGPDIHGDLAPS